MSALSTRAGHLRRRRALTDRATTWCVTAGGFTVILAMGAIVLYLGWVVAPMFAPARLSPLAETPLPGADQGATRLLGVDDSGEIGFRFTDRNAFVFFATATGETLAVRTVEGLGDERVLRIHQADPEAPLFALELSGARFLFVELRFPVSFASGRREREIVLDAPFGTAPLGSGLAPPTDVVASAVHYAEPALTVALLRANGVLALRYYAEADRGFEPFPPLELRREIGFPATRVILSGDQWLFLLDDAGTVGAWNVQYKDDPFAAARTRVAEGIAAVAPLLGGNSLLVADGNGQIAQWFLERADDGAWAFVSPRVFTGSAPVLQLLPEVRRRGFLALERGGRLAIYHTTAERRLLDEALALREPRAMAISARGDLLLADDGRGALKRWEIDNPHPEISLSALWGEVWYEGYPAPDYVWQSSSSSTAFEPKFSLTPLAFGTLKASAYALLFAIPLAVLGALYTAFFMAPAMRAWVKPSIELMAALPTVILGFIGGLWLAPLVERNLTAVLGLLLLLPLSILLVAAAWTRLPGSLQRRVPGGWQAIILLPLVAGVVACAFAFAPTLDVALFDGDLRSWLQTRFGIDYDQRNALIVGMVMGVAVIPTIFSIAEDSVHGVPRGLVQGSLALGATPWQTLLHVVLPTASPGIFSALVIGLGRAVGETMIVLMATGNTPIMEFGPFDGMRTFSANIAVEMPESEVGSSHYRILFLTALVLFVMTFALNTVAEIVRQRLRRRYGSL
jgi:phosphate transport system permease protein